jgi:hypothetical protein
MLTEDKIKANGLLASLTPEQIAAITTLSQNDENAVIGQRIGELHGQYDKDLKETFGMERNQGEKTYDYLKRVGKAFQDQNGSDTLKKQIEDLTKERDELKKSVTDGKGDEQLRKDLADVQNRLSGLQSQYNKEKKDWESKVQEKEKEVLLTRVENVLDQSITGLKFRDEKLIPESVRKLVIQTAKKAVLDAGTPDWVDDGKGGKMLVFRDANGMTINNPNNTLNPYTAQELMMEHLKDIIEPNKPNTGAGGKGVPGATTTTSLDLTGTRSQNEADDRITTFLMAKGLARGTEAFESEYSTIRKENNIEKLPIV